LINISDSKANRTLHGQRQGVQEKMESRLLTLRRLGEKRGKIKEGQEYLGVCIQESDQTKRDGVSPDQPKRKKGGELVDKGASVCDRGAAKKIYSRFKKGDTRGGEIQKRRNNRRSNRMTEIHYEPRPRGGEESTYHRREARGEERRERG